jgi:hypothetical protein
MLLKMHNFDVTVSTLDPPHGKMHLFMNYKAEPTEGSD